MKKEFIHVGDNVVALASGSRDRAGLPLDVPERGKTYKVASIYAAPYGIGCTLEGMMHGPYQGYILEIRSHRLFRKVEA